MNLKIIMVNERSQIKKKSMFFMIPFIKNSGKIKLMCSDRKHISGCLGVDRQERGITQRGKTKLEDSTYVHYFDCGDGLMNVNICQNLSNFTFYLWADANYTSIIC